MESSSDQDTAEIMDMEVSPVEQNQVALKSDTGLELLLPLYQFLRNDCANVVHQLLIKEFRNCEYIQEHFNADAQNIRLGEFLLRVQGNKKREKGKSKSNQVSQPPSERSPQIHNIPDHEDILNEITVRDLINQDVTRCNVLRKLDLSFVLNLIASNTLMYRISDNVLSAVNKIKNIRNSLFHCKYQFELKDFNENLEALIKETQVLHEALDNPFDVKSISEKYGHMSVNDKSSEIFEKLRTEIHERYISSSTYVHPNIADVSSDSEVIVEDITKFVFERSNLDSKKSPPVLICGSPGTGKSSILRNIASSACTSSKFSLVLYLEDWERKSKPRKGQVANINSSTAFWEQVYCCIKYLAENTVRCYGLESVKAVIKENMGSILFLVDWSIPSKGSLFKEMEVGTWVVAHDQELGPRTNDWKVLKIKPYTVYQVEQLLCKYCAKNGSDNYVVELYRKCDYKEILVSPDMVKVFWELRSSVHFDTDFELIKAYVSDKLKIKDLANIESKCGIVKIGEIAFNSLKEGNNIVYNRDNELDQIDSEIKYLFLKLHESGRLRFIHSSVQEFLAALYVTHQPFKACRNWLCNAPNFSKVFKYACGLWCSKGFQSKRVILTKEVMLYLEEYLVELFDIKCLKKTKEHKNTDQMEMDKETPKTKKETRKVTTSENPFRDPFTSWNYLIDLDDVCQGQPQILDLFVKLLTSIKCWTFNTNTLDGRKLKRLAIIMKKVKLNETFPVTIRLESTQDVSMLLKMWNNLKNIESMHNYSSICIIIAPGKGFPFAQKESLIMLCTAITRAYCPVYITSYQGPLLCTETPEFLKCHSLSKLNTIDVTVYDFASLKEIMKCDDLSHLKYLSVTVELLGTEQLVDFQPFKIPKYSFLKLRIKYFDNIQKLLEMGQHPENLYSLCIYDVYVKENFKLMLSAFKHVEILTLIFQPKNENIQCNVLEKSIENKRYPQTLWQTDMDFDASNTFASSNQTVPRENWMLPITVSVLPPAKLERLVLRNVDFYNNLNNYLLLQVLEKYNIKKLIILDSKLSLKGVKHLLSSQAGNESDVEAVTKKLKVNNLDTTKPNTVILKKVRLSEVEREERKKNKPEGKEIVITSDIGLCQDCQSFPCVCPNRKASDNLDDVVSLINDVYQNNLTHFSYSSKIVTILKNVCGDLRIHCTLPGLDDASARNILSVETSLNKFFLALSVAQSITLEQTLLTFEGTEALIYSLKDVKQKFSEADHIEPFSLTVRSSYHPFDNEKVDKFMELIQRESVFSSFNFWCTCENKCFKIKKTYKGKMIYNDRVQGE